MATLAAAALYEAMHNLAHEGLPFAVHNPLNKPISELPFIYGFNNGGSAGWFYAVLLAEDGECLGSHICPSEAYMPADLGVLAGTRPDRHCSSFQPHYPEGYQMEFVPYDAVLSHAGLQKAIEINKAMVEAIDAAKAGPSH